jgi:hypothetical protein
VKRALRASGLLLAIACNTGTEHPGPQSLVHPSDTGGEGDAGGIEPPPDECGADFCGDSFLSERRDPPNLYFLVDRSGSMGATPEGSSRNKYDMARRVIGDLLRAIGHRVRYGAAIFPASSTSGECGPGREVIPFTLGQPPSCTGATDPALPFLLGAFGKFPPGGTTPTSAALRELVPELEDLGGSTSLVLVTDGAPNCNFEASCGAEECTLNIEGATLGTTSCSGNVNCCDPDVFGEGAAGNCVDREESVRQVERLAESGILTYVIGMPGAEPYATVLDALAEAGGTARSGTTAAYYAVGDQEELEEALYAIGTGLAISCSIDLEAPPDDPRHVNVYFDGEVVPADADDGWSWDGDSRIVVHGEACDTLKSGSVIDARAVFGCETVVR